MDKFLMIVRGDLEKIRKQAEEERFAEWPDMIGWVKAVTEAGNYIQGQPLVIGGRYVSQHEVLSDGPFIESKESVLGYDIIQAKDIDEAVAIAQSCPMVTGGFAIREVRQLMEPFSLPITPKKPS